MACTTVLVVAPLMLDSGQTGCSIDSQLQSDIMRWSKAVVSLLGKKVVTATAKTRVTLLSTALGETGKEFVEIFHLDW